MKKLKIAELIPCGKGVFQTEDATLVVQMTSDGRVLYLRNEKRKGVAA